MNDVFLCLGGNLGNRPESLENCRLQIASHCGKITARSAIYETEAWGTSSGNKFLNQVIRIKTSLSAAALLKKLLRIEKKLGRKRTDIRNADRIIDIDILFFNREIIKTSAVEIPHPRLHLRKFVLKPMMDISPEFAHPLLKRSVKQLYKACGDKLEVRKFEPVEYICVEGNIGSGKTTLAKALAKHLRAEFLPEQFEKNDLLPLFYEDPDTFAFPLEYSFLLGRYQQITDAFKHGKKCLVSDYSIYKCRWFAAHNLKRADYVFFKKHFAAIEGQLVKPQLIIYLETSTKNLKKNIAARGRPYEKGMTVKYLKGVARQYSKGISALPHSKVLRISIGGYHRGLNGELIKTIKKYLDKT
jgi:deoxyguanosine kinase